MAAEIQSPLLDRLLAPQELPPAELVAYRCGMAQGARSVDVAIRFLRAGILDHALATLEDLLRSMKDAAADNGA